MGNQEIGAHKQDWHSLETGDVFRQLESQASGLDKTEVDSRLEKFGANRLTPLRSKAPGCAFSFSFTI